MPIDHRTRLDAVATSRERSSQNSRVVAKSELVKRPGAMYAEEIAWLAETLAAASPAA
jgi:hypothetical protein